MLTRTILLLVILCLSASSCSYFANRPLHSLEYRHDQNEATTKVFIFMRGLGGSHRSFAKAGMVDAVHSRDIPFDIIAPNAHFAYYSERTLIERLHQDIIEPAKSRGYTTIWLVGVSMGGLGSMLYLKERPEDIDGVYLVAPFLGYEEILAEIDAAGGVRSWEPGDYDSDKDWERMFWHWIKDEVADDRRRTPIFLGFGRQDEYLQGQRLLASILPDSRVMTMEGGHDQETIAALWRLFLERMPMEAAQESSPLTPFYALPSPP